MEIPQHIDERLAGLGLVTLGIAQSDDAVRILVGNTGKGFWSVFSNSPEYEDGQPDPLDRWTRRVGQALARDLDAMVFFPFDGPPYPPFLRWAAESGEAFASRIGMNIHFRLGLWHAYRFCLEFKPGQALVDAQASPLPSAMPSALPATGQTAAPTATSPCLDCESQPCLSACPVSAFDGSSYDVNACAGSLAGTDAGGCMEDGCAARRACPVSPGHRYPSAQAAFHMRAFLTARPVLAEPPDQGPLEEMPGS